ncbi:hypothetical protein HDE_04032 [Halotydeus destructor]|nr:hypothetical protein HDE_04032 [Halotydeus destructor]
MLLSSLNSCVNPWIYLFFNRNLYLTLKNKCCHPCQRTKPSRTSGRLNDYHSSMHSECTGHTTNHQDSGRDRFDRLSIGSRSRHFHSRANSPRPSFDAGLLPIKATLLDGDQHVDPVGQSQSNKVTSPEAVLATAVIETSA